MSLLLDRARIIQTAYVVADLDLAMQTWNARLGIGPFVVLRHIPVRDVQYRGQAAELDFSAAFVQSGDLNIELIEQHDSSPSAFRDMFAAGEQGLHHVALIADDFERDIGAFDNAGFPVATRFSTGPASAIAFIDTRPWLGHMLEVYQNRGAIEALYSRVREAAGQWDGKRLVQE